MQLVLIRHAIAGEPDARRWPDDGDRPLTRRGVRRFRRAASGLASVFPRPDCVLTSPLLRTRQTAGLLASSGGWPAAQAAPVLRPGAPAIRLCRWLATVPGERVVLVGHEPDLGRLLALLLGGEESHADLRFRKGGAACVTFSANPAPGAGQLQWFLPPRLLRALA